MLSDVLQDPARWDEEEPCRHFRDASKVLFSKRWAEDWAKDHSAPSAADPSTISHCHASLSLRDEKVQQGAEWYIN